ncbi:peroxiredoxin family protein [Bacillus smithii]|uniref:peroxiredoxin family protein n=1 Tax=Bacillus smithii TaxID=1479 RepID=UPI003D23D916
MTSLQLYSELDLLNIIIAMSFDHNSSGVENIFYQEGYRIVSIDRSVDIDVGTIKYDIYLSNWEKNMSLGFELKGLKASNLELEQFNKYQNIPIQQYITVGGAFYQDINTHRLQTVIGINKSREEEVKNFIQLHGFTFPLLTIDRDSSIIQIVYNELIDKKMHTKLQHVFYDTFGIPTYIFYDKESKDYQIAPRIINKIFQFAKNDKSVFSVNEIIEETYCAIPGLYQIIGPDVKKSVIVKIKKILRDMSKNEFSSYLKWDHVNKKWSIKRISSNSHFNTDSAFLQLGKQYVDRLKQNLSYPLKGDNFAEQLSLFDYEEMLEKATD